MKEETQNINRQFLNWHFVTSCENNNLPSPPLPKGDFAPFQEMYLTSGIIVAEMQHAATHVVGLMDCWDLAIIIP